MNKKGYSSRSCQKPIQVEPRNKYSIVLDQQQQSNSITYDGLALLSIVTRYFGGLLGAARATCWVVITKKLFF